LLWEDIRDNVEHPYIYVQCEKKRKGEKWRRRRKVPFYGGRDGSMMELIRELRKRWYTGNPKDPVFKGVSRGRGFNKHLAAACKELKIMHDGKPLVLCQHDLRHIFATRCVEEGADWKTLAEWLGHEDGGILAAKIYTSSRDDHSFEIAERLGKHKKREKPETNLESNHVCQVLIVDGKTYTAEAVRGMLARSREAEAESTVGG
jgi:integrase